MRNEYTTKIKKMNKKGQGTRAEKYDTKLWPWRHDPVYYLDKKGFLCTMIGTSNF